MLAPQNGPARPPAPPMGAIWAGVFLIVAVFGGLAPDWGRIEQAAGGSGDALVWAVAGYTLPLTAGFALIGFLLLRLRGRADPPHPMMSLTVAGAILWVAGLLARWSGLGKPPADTGDAVFRGGLPNFFLNVLGTYISSYGWPLVICALAIGVGVALQAEAWLINAD